MSPIDRLRKTQQEHNLAPSGMVIATDTPMRLKEVLILAEVRYFVAEVLSREEFAARRRRNKVIRDKQELEYGMPLGGTFLSKLDGAVAKTAVYTEEIPAEAKYFYQMERLD